jgi:hypothetical protein
MARVRNLLVGGFQDGFRTNIATSLLDSIRKLVLGWKAIVSDGTVFRTTMALERLDDDDDIIGELYGPCLMTVRSIVKILWKRIPDVEMYVQATIETDCAAKVLF